MKNRETAEIKLYEDALLATRRFEIDPDQTRPHTFNVPLYKSGEEPDSESVNFIQKRVVRLARRVRTSQL